MKRVIIIILIFCSFSLYSRERVYISTDKDVYVAGGNIWYSLYCFDQNLKGLSDLSKIAYVELISPNGLISTHKSALNNGRGSGCISVSPNIPTGNYVIVAYTSISPDNANIPIFRRDLTIFNPLSQEVIENYVEIDEELSGEVIRKIYPDNSSNITINTPEGTLEKETVYNISLDNLSDSYKYLNISIFHNDSIFSSESRYMADQISGDNYPEVKIDVSKLEYEGEIITVEIENYSDIIGKQAFISTLGSNENIYSSSVNEDGTVKFITNNIFDETELFFSIKDHDKVVSAQLRSPFRNIEIKYFPKLYLSSSMGRKVDEKGVKMQIEKRFGLDTLVTNLELSKRRLLYSNPVIHPLDDYTRFPVMEELFIEFIYEARVRVQSSKPIIQVRCTDIFRQLYYSSNSIIMVDGIPVWDHKLFLDYDPLLIKNINVYPDRYIIGGVIYEGLIEAETYRKDAAGFNFENNTILSYIPPYSPVAYTGANLKIGDSSTPDMRETIYWHPDIKIEGNKSFDFSCLTPAYSGKFTIVVEGVDSDGSPIFYTSDFYVK